MMHVIHEVKMIQLELFEQDEITILRHKFNDLKDSADRVRKGQYAKLGDLQKKYDDLLTRMEVLERHICQM